MKMAMVSPLRCLALTLILTILMTLSACGPEASRARGAPGADTGNRSLGSPSLQIHGETNPGWDTPLLIPTVEAQE
jgi:hypothetical protein